MPIKVRVYRCRCWDVVLKSWEISRFRYTLEEIAKLTRCEPIMNDLEEAERLTPEEAVMTSTSAIMRAKG